MSNLMNAFLSAACLGLKGEQEDAFYLMLLIPVILESSRNMMLCFSDVSFRTLGKR